jgi:hypothetical protein
MIPEFDQRRQHFDTMFRELCCSNEDAIHVCWSVFQFLHVIDDLVDRDVQVSVDTVGLTLLTFTEAVSANPFFQTNRDILLGALRVGVIEWLDSERWKLRPDVREQMAAMVMKSQYQNFFFLVASLCGGITHMAACAQKYRQFQWD